MVVLLEINHIEKNGLWALVILNEDTNESEDDTMKSVGLNQFHGLYLYCSVTQISATYMIHGFRG